MTQVVAAAALAGGIVIEEGGSKTLFIPAGERKRLVVVIEAQQGYDESDPWIRGGSREQWGSDGGRQRL